MPDVFTVYAKWSPEPFTVRLESEESLDVRRCSVSWSSEMGVILENQSHMWVITKTIHITTHFNFKTNLLQTYPTNKCWTKVPLKGTKYRDLPSGNFAWHKVFCIHAE